MVIFLLGLCLLLRLPGLWMPLIDIDESQFALFATTLLEGGRPYLDSVDTKPLGIYWFFEVCFRLFGKNNMIAVHAVTALWVFATALVIQKIAAKVDGLKTGFWAALFYIIFSTTYTPKFIATSITLLMMLPLTLSVLALLQWEETKKDWWIFCSGLFFGIGCLFKYQAGIHLILGLGYIFFISRSMVRGPWSVVLFLLYLSGAAFIGLGFIFYLQSTGVWDAFWIWSLKGSVGYIEASLSAVLVLQQIVIRFGSFVLTTLFLWILTGMSLKRWRSASPPCRLMILWLLLSFIPVFTGFRFYGHYFIQLLPALAILAACAWVRTRQSKRWLILGAGFPALGCLVARIFIAPIHDWVGEENLNRYQPVSQYVAQLTAPDEKIYVWGFATPIYFYSERKPASRFLWNDWQTGRVGGGSKLASQGKAIPTFETHLAWTLLLEDLEKNKPGYFLDTAPGNYHNYGKFLVSRYPQLVSYLNEHYILAEQRFGVDFYRRKSL